MTNLDNGCDCRTAVVRTFDELRRRNMNKTAALEMPRQCSGSTTRAFLQRMH